MNVGQLPDENELKRLFVHYKNFYVSGGIVFVCIMLIFWFIFPEMQQYSDQRAQLQEVQDRVDILKKNISFVSTINEKQQTEDLQTTIEALPQDKDYAGVLYAVKSASARSNVSIGDFSFGVGELSTKAVITKNTPYLSLHINMSGTPSQVSDFLVTLAKTLPLSQVNQITLNNSFADINVDFYYKPISQLQVNYSLPISPVSKTNQQLLEDLKSWQSINPSFDVAASDASSSAAPFGQ